MTSYTTVFCAISTALEHKFCLFMKFAVPMKNCSSFKNRCLYPNTGITDRDVYVSKVLKLQIFGVTAEKI